MKSPTKTSAIKREPVKRSVPKGLRIPKPPGARVIKCYNEGHAPNYEAVIPTRTRAEARRVVADSKRPRLSRYRVIDLVAAQIANEQQLRPHKWEEYSSSVQQFYRAMAVMYCRTLLKALQLEHP